MKKKLLLIGLSLVVVATLLLFGGCDSDYRDEINVNDGRVWYKGWEWYIEKSPITGRYYEVRKAGTTMAMSEVTEAEYNKYLEMIEDE